MVTVCGISATSLYQQPARVCLPPSLQGKGKINLHWGIHPSSCRYQPILLLFKESKQLALAGFRRHLATKSQRRTNPSEKYSGSYIHLKADSMQINKRHHSRETRASWLNQQLKSNPKATSSVNINMGCRGIKAVFIQVLIRNKVMDDGKHYKCWRRSRTKSMVTGSLSNSWILPVGPTDSEVKKHFNQSQLKTFLPIFTLKLYSELKDCSTIVNIRNVFTVLSI